MSLEKLKEELLNEATKEKEATDIEDYEAILEELVYCLKEANPKTCSRKNKYEKEWAEYNAKHDALCIDWTEGNIEEDENAKKSLELIDENIDLIEKHTDDQKLVFAYQKECKKKALELLFKYFDSIRLSDFEFSLYYGNDEIENGQ